MVDIKAVRKVSIFCADKEKTVDFYSGVLGLNKIWEDEERARYRCGDVFIDLIPDPVNAGKSINKSVILPSEDELLFEVEDMAAYEQLKWSLVQEDITLLEVFCSTSKNKKVLCKDPDGHTIAITTKSNSK